MDSTMTIAMVNIKSELQDTWQYKMTKYITLQCNAMQYNRQKYTHNSLKMSTEARLDVLDFPQSFVWSCLLFSCGWLQLHLTSWRIPARTNQSARGRCAVSRRVKGIWQLRLWSWSLCWLPQCGTEPWLPPLPASSTAPSYRQLGAVRSRFVPGNRAEETARTHGGDKPLFCSSVTSLWTDGPFRVTRPTGRVTRPVWACVQTPPTTTQATGLSLIYPRTPQRCPESSTSRRSSSCRRTRASVMRAARRRSWAAAEARSLLRETVTCCPRPVPRLTTACSHRRSDRGSPPRCCRSRAATRCPQSHGKGRSLVPLQFSERVLVLLL